MTKTKKLMTDARASVPANSSLAEYMINYYFTYEYQGSEHHHVIERFYATRLYWELLIQLARFEKNSLIQKFKKNFNMKKEILKQKIRSYKNRKRCYFEWFDVLGGKESNDETVKLLANIYKSTSCESDVKRELGLNQTLEELKNEYHRSI